MTDTPRAGALPELLLAWLPRQRWFAAKSSGGFTLARTGSLMLQEGSGGVGIEVFLVTATFEDGTRTTYQVPLTYRDVPVRGLEHALVGILDDPRRGTYWIYDGPHDAAFVAAWLQLMTDEAEATCGEDPEHGRARGVRAIGAPDLDPDWPSHVMRGEQSNSSIVVGSGVAETPVIVKIFRVLAEGPNPEAVVASALAVTASPRIPRPIGNVEVTWTTPDGRVVTGHLAAAARFFPGSQDAWRMACAAVEAEQCFDIPARELGEATAEVHDLLARVLPTREADAAAITALADGLDERVAWAAREAPLLEQYVPGARAVVEAVRELESVPGLQHIHGDYHLGQVLNVEGAGWVLFDFEGEPLRPLVQRNVPDLPLRDLAGMVRSFDYAARHATLGLVAGDGRVQKASVWAVSAREAFLDGYASVAGRDPREDAVLLRALELDKALYEVVYEMRNRPDWVEVPLAAVARLLAEPKVPEPRESDPLPTPVRDEGPGPRAPATGDGDGTGSPTDAVEVTDGSGESRLEDVTDPQLSTPDTPAPAVPEPAVVEPAPADAGPAGDAQPAGAPAIDAEPTERPATPEEDPLTTTVPDPTSELATTGARPPEARPVDPDTLSRVATGSYHDPHSVLGAHPYGGALTVRVLRPFAQSVEVALEDGSRHPMTHEWDGLWQVVLPVDRVTDYRLRVSYEGVGESVCDDPYRFLPTLGEMDLHLIREGRHEELWKVMGAHVRRFDGPMGEVVGTSFAVWAPNALAVRVVGGFNHWNGREHAMRSLGSSGVWELFIPGVGAGSCYKFEILGRDGHWRQKADPMARGTECPPATASVVVDSDYTWNDDAWLAERASRSAHAAPMSIYEVHLGGWRPGLTYRELADQLTEYVTDMGFTHVEFMPVAEHPYGPSWGYQVTSYYAPTSRFGHPDDFRHLVDRLHQAGIGVIMDWVPAHFPKDDWALARFDGEPLYEYGDPQRGEHPDWGTLVFNYGRTEVRNFLVANALYWLEEFHIDGLRVDAVASMLYLDYSRGPGQWSPNIYGGREHLEAISFLQEMNATAYKRVPGIVTIAEESTAWGGVTKPTHVGGLGFGVKWNMGWMHDSLVYMSKEPVHRQYHHHQMTFSMIYAYSENFVLPISHDEVVHGKGALLAKMPGDRWQQLANARAYLAYMWAHPGKQLLFMGSELGEDQEWSESRSLHWWLQDTPWHAGLQQAVRDLNRLYKEHPALWTQDNEPAGFEWIDADDHSRNVFSFVRRGVDGDQMVCVVNFSAIPYEDFRIGLPKGGHWVEVLNTDHERYAGSGVTNPNGLQTDEIEWNGRQVSAALRIPPLGAVWLKPVG